MPCFSPLTAFRSKDVGVSGKRALTFNRQGSLSGIPLRIPCGQCVGCRLERSRQWAMRCLHEKRLHKDTCFLTLTYRTELLPPGGTLVKRDLQLFMKRLRKHAGKVRFYACGEYGDVNKRPHYHVLLYGYAFPDLKPYGVNRRHEKYFTSKVLEEIWGKGLCVVGAVTFDSAAYVARYVMKKVTGDASRVHYRVVDGDGVVTERIAEFTLMSRKPGIGTGWYVKYGEETYVHDSVIVNGKEVRPPRFYDTKFELANPEKFVKLKKLRRRRMRLFRADNTVDRRRVKERLQWLRMRELQRRV